MGKIHKYSKLVILDTVGILLIIASVAFGWLPGPGGIPLFLAGLAVLSVHHEWAKRWFEYIKRHGFKFLRNIFSDNNMIKNIYDMFSVVAIAGAIYLLISSHSNFNRGLAIFLLFTGCGLFLGNRGRLDWILSKIRSNKHKN